MLNRPTFAHIIPASRLSGIQIEKRNSFLQHSSSSIHSLEELRIMPRVMNILKTIQHSAPNLVVNLFSDLYRNTKIKWSCSSPHSVNHQFRYAWGREWFIILVWISRKIDCKFFTSFSTGSPIYLLRENLRSKFRLRSSPRHNSRRPSVQLLSRMYLPLTPEAIEFDWITRNAFANILQFWHWA